MTVHPQLRADTHYLGRFELSHCLLMNDSRYPWIILVPDVDGAEEIYRLSTGDRQQLLNESCLVQQFMADNLSPDKLNIGALGNIVPQLHLHHIARNIGDPAWPGPVWGHSPAVSYRPDALKKLISLIRKNIELIEQQELL